MNFGVYVCLGGGGGGGVKYVSGMIRYFSKIEKLLIIQNIG